MTYQNYMDYTNKSPNYSDHTNWNGSAWVANYRDHQNYTRDDGVAPPTGDRQYVYNINTPAGAFTQDAYIKDQIENIKKLRDDTEELATRKVTSTGGTNTPNPASSYNKDTDFEEADYAIQQQVEETIANVKTLWQSMKGNNDNNWSGWPADEQEGQRRKASDYNVLRDKLQNLAQTSKPAGYADHKNIGTK